MLTEGAFNFEAVNNGSSTPLQQPSIYELILERGFASEFIHNYIEANQALLQTAPCLFCGGNYHTPDVCATVPNVQAFVDQNPEFVNDWEALKLKIFGPPESQTN